MAPFAVFQTAYVVRDLSRACASFGERLGIGPFLVNRDVPIDTAAGQARCHFALAAIDGLQIELIEPAGGADAIYREMLEHGPAPAEARLHHLGTLIVGDEAWRARLEAIRAAGLATPVSGSFGALMDYVYADTRGDLGHYLEFMHPGEAGLSLFDAVPQYKVWGNTEGKGP